MPARGRLPRCLPGRHSAAPHPGRQDAEGAGRHEEAAEALRTIIALRSGGPERPLLDEWTGTKVRYLFLRRGRPMSAFYLFNYSLRDACKAAGLVDADGRATVTAHRFRHTVGTQLAERGAKLHTIMSVLGHESPHMSMIYARISDAEVLRDYRSSLLGRNRSSALPDGNSISYRESHWYHSSRLATNSGRRESNSSTEHRLSRRARLPA
jgi:hypothetical protein